MLLDAPLKARGSTGRDEMPAMGRTLDLFQDRPQRSWLEAPLRGAFVRRKVIACSKP